MKTSRLNRYRIALALAASSALHAGMAWGNPIVLNNTGVPGANATPDLNYVLVSSPVGPNAYIVDTPIAGWIANQSGSKWISPVANPSAANPPTGTYDYRTTFDLTGLDPSTAVITGTWAMDNSGTALLLNGASTGNTAPPSGNGFSQLTPFSISSGFVAGINTLDFIVLNAGTGFNPSGLQVNMTGTAAVPEPASLAILAIASWLLLSRRRRDGRIVAALFAPPVPI